MYTFFFFALDLLWSRGLVDALENVEAILRRPTSALRRVTNSFVLYSGPRPSLSLSSWLHLHLTRSTLLNRPSKVSQSHTSRQLHFRSVFLDNVSIEEGSRHPYPRAGRSASPCVWQLVINILSKVYQYNVNTAFRPVEFF